MDLMAKYNSTRAKCCKCGCVLETLYSDERLGDYFVMDNDGNFYCICCDSIFEDGDERIFVPEE